MGTERDTKREERRTWGDKEDGGEEDRIRTEGEKVREGTRERRVSRGEREGGGKRGEGGCLFYHLTLLAII